MTTVVRPIVHCRSCSRTRLAGVNLAGQRFQMHFLRLLSKLNIGKNCVKKLQNSSNFQYVYIFFEFPLFLLTRSWQDTVFKLLASIPLKLSELKNYGWWRLRAQKSSKLGCAYLILSFHLSWWGKVGMKLVQRKFHMVDFKAQKLRMVAFKS